MACSEVPQQLQHSSRLAELRLKRQQPSDVPIVVATAEAMCVLLHSHRQDLPAWLLELPHLRALQVGTSCYHTGCHVQSLSTTRLVIRTVGDGCWPSGCCCTCCMHKESTALRWRV